MEEGSGVDDLDGLAREWRKGLGWMSGERERESGTCVMHEFFLNRIANAIGSFPFGRASR